MSKYVKDLMTQELGTRLAGVDDALFVNLIGLDGNQSVDLRRQLREKNIHLLLVKKSLARRAAAHSPLSTALGECEGSLAVAWGGEDFVSLAKEITRLSDDAKQFPAFQTRGGVMDGESLTPDRVKEISKWPSREEQLSLVSGQILGPGSGLLGAIVGPGAQLASQIEQKGKGEEGSDTGE
jgi:large subunit ribosomal protein L10